MRPHTDAEAVNRLREILTRTVLERVKDIHYRQSGTRGRRIHCRRDLHTGSERR